jgi:hypothetical protein
MFLIKERELHIIYTWGENEVVCPKWKMEVETNIKTLDACIWANGLTSYWKF